MRTRIEPTFLTEDQRELLLEYLTLSTPEEFSEKLNSLADKLTTNGHFKNRDVTELREKILRDTFTLANGPSTTLEAELELHQIVLSLAELLKNNNLKQFESELSRYGLERPNAIRHILSRKFLGPDGKQTCLLNLAITNSFENKTNSHIKKLISLGAEIDIDFGYHAQKHPNREIPPLIKAIQLSNEYEGQQAFYTEIVNYLIQNGASINKVADNPSPLWAAYNPIPIPYNLSRAPSGCTTSHYPSLDFLKFRERYLSHLRNKGIFQDLLTRGAKTDEFDIISSAVKTPVAPSNMLGHKAFQLLYFIDEDLRNKDNYEELYRKQLKEDFFNPLFNKIYTDKMTIGEKLQGYTFEFLDKEPSDSEIEPNKLYMYVDKDTLKYAVNTNKIIKRVLITDHLNQEYLKTAMKACQTRNRPDNNTLAYLVTVTTKMGYPQRKVISTLSQTQMDEMVKRGEIFSNVTARYTGHVSDFLTRIKTNDSAYIMSFMFTKDEKPFNMLENQCIAGEYNVPTHYYAARSRQMLEGVGFFHQHVNPHMTAKTDIFSVPREVGYHDAERDGELFPQPVNRTVSVAVALDLEFKISNLNPHKAYEKAQQAEARRTLQIKEHSFRANVEKNVPGPSLKSEFIDLSTPQLASSDELRRVVKKEKGRVQPLHHSKIYNVKESDYFDHNIDLLYGDNIQPQLSDLKPNTMYFYVNKGLLRCIVRIDNQMVPLELEKLDPKIASEIKEIVIHPKSKERLSVSQINHIIQNVDHLFQFPTSVYHGECLADIYQFDMILDIKNPQFAANLNPEETYRRQHQKTTVHKVGEDMYDSLLDIRALQKQRQTFLFTGKQVPIARTDATTGAIKILNIDEIDTLRTLIKQLLSTSQLRKTKLHQREINLLLIIPEYFDANLLVDALKHFATSDSLESLNTLSPLSKETLLLWALDMGFRNLASELIVRGVKLTGKVGGECKVLSSTIEKGLVDEAKYLIDSGVELSVHQFSTINTPFDSKFNYLVHFSNVLQLMQAEPKDQEVEGGKVYLYVDKNTNTLMYSVLNKYSVVERTPIVSSKEIPQEQIESIKTSIAQNKKLSHAAQTALSKTLPECYVLGFSTKKLDIHFSGAYQEETLNNLHSHNVIGME